MTICTKLSKVRAVESSFLKAQMELQEQSEKMERCFGMVEITMEYNCGAAECVKSDAC